MLTLIKNLTVAESYMFRDTSRNGQIDTVTFTETGVNTGIFTASVPTVFGTTKARNGKNVTFKAQAGDTLYLFYTDTLAANGGPGAAMVGKDGDHRRAYCTTYGKYIDRAWCFGSRYTCRPGFK